MSARTRNPEPNFRPVPYCHALSSGHRCRLVAVSLVIGFAALSVAVLPARVAGAATDVVTTCAGFGTGSLPAVVADAGSDDTITFSVSCPPTSPIQLSSPIDITQDLTISGPGVGAMAVSGTQDLNVFQVASDVTVTISGITIENGQADGGTGTGGGGIHNDGMLTVTESAVTGNAASNAGGGIYNDGTLTVTDSTVSDNGFPSRSSFMTEGAGIYNEGTLSVVDSTVSGNSTWGFAGALFNDASGTASIDDSTFANNWAYDGGGAVFNKGTIDMTASDIVGNTAFGEGGSGIDNDGGMQSLAATIVDDYTWGNECTVYSPGTAVDGGYNIDDDDSCGFSTANHSQSDVDPDVGPMQNNGGPTPTEAPAVGSPALNQIPVGTMANGTTLCPGTDQRGDSRPQGSECDIGSVERTGPASDRAAQNITFTSTAPSDATVNGPTYDVTAGGGNSGNPVIFTVDSSSTSVCELTGSGSITESTVEFNGTGVCTIDAHQAGDSDYVEAPQVHQSFDVRSSPSAPTITNIPGSDVAIFGGSFVPSVNTSGDGTKSVTSSTASICTVSSGTVNFVGVGTCTLTAHVAVGTNYGSADGTPQSFDISPQPQGITSADSASAKVHTSFSFLVTTSGAPAVPSITIKDNLPKHLTLVDNHNGTATIAGKLAKTGNYRFIIKATFGNGKTKNVVAQRFTLTVDRA